MPEDDPKDPAEIGPLIVEMATKRDKAAFVKIFRFCAPRIMHYLETRANGVLEAADLEEVCQETFATTWHDSTGFDPAKHEPIGWLFAIARTLAIQTLASSYEHTDAVDSLRTDVPKPREIDDGLAAGERMRRLRDALQGLSSRQAAILHDVYVHGLSHTATARKRNLPIGTVKSDVQRALASLRERMARGGQ